MSLKAFHLIFVTLMMALCIGFSAWAFTGSHPVLGVGGVAAAILVVFYGFHFLKKLKNISYL